MQGTDMLFEISVFNVLNVDFGFTSALLYFNSYFVERRVSCVFFHTFKRRLFYLLRR